MTEISAVSLSAAASAGTGGTSSAPVSDGQQSVVAYTSPIRNPRVVQDPVVGFITEYVNRFGDQVVEQIPSVRAVMYLRQGLSEDGRPLKSGVESSMGAVA